MYGGFQMVQPRSQSFIKRVRQEAGAQMVARGPDSGQGLQGGSVGVCFTTYVEAHDTSQEALTSAKQPPLRPTRLWVDGQRVLLGIYRILHPTMSQGEPKRQSKTHDLLSINQRWTNS